MTSATNGTRVISQPRVSIVIPTYNHIQYVVDAIGSAIRQTVDDIEIIVVDDGSTDGTWRVLQDLKDPRIHTVRQANSGLSAARNTGLSHARGRYISFLDADDLYEEDFVELLASILDADADLAAAYSGWQAIDEQNRTLAFGSDRTVRPEAFYEAVAVGNFLVPACMLVRCELLVASGGFDTSLHACEDWDMWLRLSKRRHLAGCARRLVRYRVLQGSMSSDPDKMMQHRLKVLGRQIGPLTANLGAFGRRAYAEAFLRGSVESLQNRDTNRARVWFERVSEMEPLMLEQERTYYELASGWKPRGHAHDTTLDVDTGIRVMFELLANRSESQNEMVAKKRVAVAHRAAAKLFYASGRREQARDSLKLAAELDASTILRGGFASLLAKTFVPSALLALGRVTSVEGRK